MDDWYSMFEGGNYAIDPSVMNSMYDLGIFDTGDYGQNWYDMGGWEQNYQLPSNIGGEWSGPAGDVLQFGSDTSSNWFSDITNALGSGASSLLSLLGGSSGKGLLGLLGLGSSIAGTTTGGDTKTTQTTQTPRISPAGAPVWDVAQQQPLTLSPKTQSLLQGLDLQSMMNVFPEQTWDQVLGSIPSTEAARMASLQTKLGQLAPESYFAGPTQKAIMQQVAAEDYNMAQLYSQMLAQKAAAQQAAAIQKPQVASSALGLSELPQSYTWGRLQDMGNLLAALEHGSTTTTKSGIDQNIWNSIAGVLGTLAS